jgi:hypothetical protein
MPIPPEHIRKMLARPDSDDRAHGVERSELWVPTLWPVIPERQAVQ